MLLLELIEWLYEHWGEVSISALLLFLLRKFIMSEIHKLLYFRRDEELEWTRQKVEELTGEKWSGPQPFLKHIQTHYSKTYSSSSRKVIQLENRLRRIKNMLNILTSSGARRVAYLLIASGVTYLNQKLGLKLNADDLFIVWGLALALMQHDAHFNLKKFISGAVTSLSGAAQSATTSTTSQSIQTVTAPPMTQQEATAMLQELHDVLQPIYNSAMSGKDSQAVQQGFQLAAQALAFIKQNKGA